MIVRWHPVIRHLPSPPPAPAPTPHRAQLCMAATSVVWLTHHRTLDRERRFRKACWECALSQSPDTKTTETDYKIETSLNTVGGSGVVRGGGGKQVLQENRRAGRSKGVRETNGEEIISTCDRVFSRVEKHEGVTTASWTQFSPVRTNRRLRSSGVTVTSSDLDENRTLHLLHGRLMWVWCECDIP